MDDDGSGDSGRRPQRRAAPRRTRPRWTRLWRAVALASVLAGFTLLVAACGGGSSAAGGSAPYQEALAYAQCMRSHGEPGFPDPDSQGLFQNPGAVDINSPQYLSASKACGHLLPASQVSTAQRQRDLGRQLKYAGCMRSHGFANIPDPVVMPNGNIEGAGPGGAAGPGSGIDTNSPQYQSARQACLPSLAGAGS
jgi:hypothetical protein